MTIKLRKKTHQTASELFVLWQMSTIIFLFQFGTYYLDVRIPDKIEILFSAYGTVAPLSLKHQAKPRYFRSG